MENATKALTIAGGVLISIIVIATLWYSFQQWGILPQAIDENDKISQEVAFNREFESYDKQNLYGTDVITVINKAIANNERYGITAETTDPYYVDVQFALISDVYGYTKTYTRTKTEETEETKDNETPFLKARKQPYSIKTDYIKLYQLCIGEPTKTTEQNRGSIFTRIEEYPGATAFRLRYFTCTGIQYEATNGRVKCITFKEVDPGSLYPVE